MKKIKIYKNQGFYRINIPKVMADFMELEKEEELIIEQKTKKIIVLKKIQKKIQKSVDI